MLGGRLHARDPDDPVKRYYTYRNRGYLVSQPGMRTVGLLEVPRFAWYFLITKRSPREFRRSGCASCARAGGSTSAGRAERPGRYGPAQARKTTVRSITKLITVARPCAITHATLVRSDISGSTASMSEFMPTLMANVVP